MRLRGTGDWGLGIRDWGWDALLLFLVRVGLRRRDGEGEVEGAAFT